MADSQVPLGRRGAELGEPDTTMIEYQGNKERAGRPALDRKGGGQAWWRIHCREVLADGWNLMEVSQFIRIR